MIGVWSYTVILTYLSLISGTVGICFAASGRPFAAICCLLISGLLDLFDGKVARTKKNRSELEKGFGIQIDSLADIVAFIVVPADGYINNMRSNWPFGEVESVKKQSANGFSLFGTGKNGIGTCFEPNDMYKGDFARIYFYAITKWKTTTWTGGNASSTFLTSLSAPNWGLTNYALDLFVRWHAEDPVDEWELNRNDNVFALQKNRNPYIDHPEWANFIWGEEEPPIGEDIKVNSIVLSSEEISLNVDAIKEISATIYPSDAKNKEIQWSSSDDNIATVNDGEIKGITPGDVTITCASLDGSNIVNRCLVHVISKDQPLADNDEIKMSLDEYPGVSSYNWYGILPSGGNI